jgi:hypothetical protein
MTSLSLLRVATVLFVAQLTTGRLYAQDAAQPGAQIWDRLGCWNCHGSNGYTNLSRAGRPSIAKTQLPLRRFVGQVRLPAGNMPPALRWLAPDADLAIVYQWVGGVDVLDSPPGIDIDLVTSAEVKADAPAAAEIEIEMVAQRAKATRSSAVLDLASLSYRVTLITYSTAPVGNRTLEYQRSGREGWSKVTLNEASEALLGRDRGFIVAAGRDSDQARARLRVPTPAGRSVLLIEALEQAQSDKPVIVGIGSVVLRAPAERARTDG